MLVWRAQAHGQGEVAYREVVPGAPSGCHASMCDAAEFARKEVAVELEDAMRTAGTCRHYKPDPVPDEVLWRLFDAARFGPSGGNRQPARFIIVRDREKKRQMKEWHLQPWRAYKARVEQGGLRIEGADRLLRDGDHYAEHLDAVPVWVLVCGIMEDIRPTDTAL